MCPILIVGFRHFDDDGLRRPQAPRGRGADEIGEGLDPDEALDLANRELHAMRRERRARRR
jgi:hypothetical protein